MTEGEESHETEEVKKSEDDPKKEQLKRDAEALLKDDQYTSFSKEDKNNLFEAFKAIDADQSWTLSTDELQVFMNECNLDSSFTNLIMKIIDKDGDGMVTFKEFLDFISLLQQVQKNSTVLFEMLFNAILDKKKDRNSNALGEQEILEFVNLFSEGSRRVEASEIKAFLEDFGDKNEKTITFEQLKKILQ